MIQFKQMNPFILLRKVCKVRYNKLSIDLLSENVSYTHIDNNFFVKEKYKEEKRKKNKLTFLPFVINCRKNHTTSNLPSDLKCIRLFIPMFVYFVVFFSVFPLFCQYYNKCHDTTSTTLYNRVHYCFWVVNSLYLYTLTFVCSCVQKEQTLLGCFI